jgi:S-formylglutathione hydrolase FrmB
VKRLTALVLLATAGCGPKQPPPPPPPELIHTTYRAIGGLSMGAVGGGGFGLRHPDRFDAYVEQGGPLDAALFLRTIDRFFLGGFCSRADIEAVMAQDPAKLNDPSAFAGCMHPPQTIQYEHAQDFNHFVFTVNAPFDRAGYFQIFSDLTLSFGNLLSESAASKYAPPGVDEQHMRTPPADFCTNPVHVKGLKNLEYNADGKYDAITFCDDEQDIYICNSDESVVDFCSDPQNLKTPLPHSMQAAFAATFCALKGGATVATMDANKDIMYRHGGVFDPCRQQRNPMRVALAVDFNGNGRRDWGEPLINNGEERYQDVGADGCSDAREDGHGGCTTTDNPGAMDLNHDNYDALSNPLGTESNWRHDDGEPFADDGLDGVPNTQDVGEGNGKFDMSPGRQAFYAHDARSLLAAMDPAAVKRFNVLFDGGIRDLFNFELTAQQVFGRIQSLRPEDSARYRDFAEIPGMKDSRTGAFQPWTHAWQRAPKNIFVLYGNENATEQDLLNGDGDHVGTLSQAVERISMLYGWVASQWPSLPRPSTPLGGTAYDQRATLTSYDSAVLGARRDFALYLPPGYDDPANAGTRYPVLYLLHGYEGDPQQMLQSTFLADTYTTDTSVKLTPMIIVMPSGMCCFNNAATGARDCREYDDSGAALLGQPGWVRECVGGDFFFNAAVTGTKYEDAFLELMDYVDQGYRTLPPADVEAR